MANIWLSHLAEGIKTAFLILSGYFVAFLRFVIPRKPKSLKDEVILVTGGSNGIGREILLNLASLEKDITLISWDVDQEANEAFIRKLRSLGVKRALGYRVDISDPAQVKQAADKVRKEAGHVTMLFNNAGIGGPIGPCWEADIGHARKAIDINFVSHWYTNGEFLPQMIRTGKGHIICMCSMAGFTMGPHVTAYMSSKHALNGYYECLKEDLRSLGQDRTSGIKISTVYPAFVATNLVSGFPVEKANLIPKPAAASEVAAAIVQAVLRDQEHIYIPRQVRCWHWMISWTPPEATRVLLDAIDFNTVLAEGAKAKARAAPKASETANNDRRIHNAATG